MLQVFDSEKPREMFSAKNKLCSKIRMVWKTPTNQARLCTFSHSPPSGDLQLGQTDVAFNALLGKGISWLNNRKLEVGFLQ